MAKAKLLSNENGVADTVVIQCPGCQCWHPFAIAPSAHPRGLTWTFNNDLERPTFTPSLDCNRDDPKTRCHSIVTDGKIQFVPGCYHSLDGQTIDLPDIED